MGADRRVKARLRKNPPRFSMDGWKMAGGDSGGQLEDCMTWGRPAEPEDSLKYACMTIGFAHRPIPLGQTKVRAYCVNCETERCVHGESVKDRLRRFKRRKLVVLGG